MECREAHILLVPHIMGGLKPGSDRCRRLEAHLASCPSCTGEYETCGRTIRFLETHRRAVALAFTMLEDERTMSRSSPPVGHGDRSNHASRLVFARWPRAIGGMAAAACMVLGLVVWWMQDTQGLRVAMRRAVELRQRGDTSVVAGGQRTAIQVELRDREGARMLAAGEVAESRADLQELRLNGKHRLVMNVHTSLSIEPLAAEARLGCLVRLRTGAIFVEVQPDGNPFVVRTAHGTATVTGTAFNLVTGAAESRLTVVEGIVRFESVTGAVDVAAGEGSRILAQDAPTPPVVCNSTAETAWTKRLGSQTRFLASSRPPAGDVIEPLPPPEPLGDGRFDSLSLDYAAWPARQRSWFARQYPEFLRLRDTLEEEGVKVDFLRLVLDADVVWLFAYPPASERRLLPVQTAAVIRAAAGQGRNVAWLKARGLYPERSGAPAESTLGVQAFVRWQQDLAAALGLPEKTPKRTLLASLHACVYLWHTRVLIWHAVESGRYPVSATSRLELLALLQRQIDASYRGTRSAITLLGGQGRDAPCESDACGWLLGELYQDLEEIIQIEGQLGDMVGHKDQ